MDEASATDTAALQTAASTGLPRHVPVLGGVSHVVRKHLPSRTQAAPARTVPGSELRAVLR